MTPAQSKIKQWREDPVSFVIEQFGVTPDGWQIEALRAFADPSKQRISLQACAGPGKSAVLAWAGWNFLVCYSGRGEHPNGAAMSVTSDNLKDNLWKEFAVWRGRSKLLQETFTWTKERIFSNDYPETWFISARSVSTKANPEEQGRTLSGLHSKFILYLIDESGDQSPAILRSAEQGLSNCSWGKILQAGNPTSQNGMLYLAATTQRHLWHVIRITGDPDDPQRSTRIDIEWAREQIRMYSRDNPWVMAFILGQFPPTGFNVLLGVEEVELAMKRHLSKDKYDWAQKRLGIDAARFGGDPWVIFPRQGLASFRPIEMRNPRSNDVAAKVALIKQKWNHEMEFIDDTGGFGSGCIDSLIQAGFSPVGVSFSGKATDPRYFNKRSEMLLSAAEWVKRGGALPPIPEIIKEFTTPTYTFVNGKFRVEEKDMVKKRLGHSTNYFDALGLTFAMPDMPGAGPYDHLIHKEKMAHEYDPFADKRESEMVGYDFDPMR